MDVQHVNTHDIDGSVSPNPMELELQTVVSCHLGAGNQLQVLYKSSQCSKLPSHLSSLVSCS